MKWRLIQPTTRQWPAKITSNFLLQGLNFETPISDSKRDIKYRLLTSEHPKILQNYMDCETGENKTMHSKCIQKHGLITQYFLTQMTRTAATWGRKYTCKNNLKSLPKATSRATPKALLSSMRTAAAVFITKSSERDSWGTGGPFLHTKHSMRGLYHQNKRKSNQKLHFV